MPMTTLYWREEKLLKKLSTFCTVAIVVCGCMSGAYVTKNPGKLNRGIRYYSPKPYLFTQPATETTTVTSNPSSTTTKIDPSGRLYKITMEYFPDVIEKYAVRVKTGLGVANVSMTLENGWNLTSIKQQLDSN